LQEDIRRKKQMLTANAPPCPSSTRRGICRQLKICVEKSLNIAARTHLPLESVTRCIISPSKVKQRISGLGHFYIALDFRAKSKPPVERVV